MESQVQISQRSQVTLLAEFFQQSAGEWHSERRYYTLQSDRTQEVESLLTIQFLQPGNAQLCELASLHELAESDVLCGAYCSWESNYRGPGQKQSTGTTVFGATETTLLRDRGFATTQPIVAQYYCPDSKLLHLRTEYNGSVFEEELKLIGSKYRTRQTIISRAGEEQMIGQYLEKRLSKEFPIE